MKTAGDNPGVMIKSGPGELAKARRRALIMAGRKPPLTNAQRQKAWRERQRGPNKRARRVAEKIYELLLQDPEQFDLAFEHIVKFLDIALNRGPEAMQISLPLDLDEPTNPNG